MVSTKTSRKGAATGRMTPPPKRTSEIGSALAATGRKIDMKEAVQAAIAFVKEYFSGAKEILLEEVGLEDGRYDTDAPAGLPGGHTFKEDPLWRVVVSFKLGEPGTLSEVMGGDPRLYRLVYIDADSGSLHSMRAWGR